jgi:hypothetical protein
METKIIKSLTNKNGLYPIAVEKLKSHFQQPLYYQEHNMRHPLGVYNISVGKVLACFKDVLRELLAVSQIIPSNDLRFKDSDLLKNTERLLHSFMEHFDDCEKILASFFPKGEILSKQPAYNNFQNITQEYRKHIGKVVNYLKHQHGRLRSIVFFTGNDGNCAGYFIEGVDEKGGLGPTPLIHSGGNTAFSYSRDLRYHFYNLFSISKALSDSIDLVSKSGHDTEQLEEIDKKDMIDIVSLIYTLPLLVFPDEFEKEFPIINFQNSQEGEFVLNLQMKILPYGLKKVTPSSKVQVLFEGDGISRSFRFPYREYKKSS